jgi:hypothetical protein
MFTAMLLGTLALAGPAATDPDPALRVWFDQDEGYMRGDRVKVFLKTRDDRYVVVFHLDPENRLRVLFPLDPGDDNYVRGGKRYKVVGRGGRDGFTAEVSGQGTVFAAASADPFRFDEFTRDQYWDFRALNAAALEGDVEQAFVDLVQRMSTGRFDYDIIRYAAFADASEVLPAGQVPYDLAADIPTCLGCRPNTVVVMGAGGPAWCASPLYDPWCYDPFAYAPGWVPPAYWNAGWGWNGWNVGWGGGSWYGGGWYGGGWGGGGYWPVPGPGVNQYDYKQATRRWSDAGPGYRYRGNEFENVNTVVGPLPSTGRTVPADRRRIWGGGGTVPVPVVANSPTVSRPAGGATGGSQPQPRRREATAAAPAAGGSGGTVAAPKSRSGEGSSASPEPRRSWSGKEESSPSAGGSSSPARSRGNEGSSSAPSAGGGSARSGGGSSGGSAPSGGGSTGGGGRRRG